MQAGTRLIADIGGTSSRWIELRPDGQEQVHDGLPGFNPTSGTPDPMREALRSKGFVQADRVTELTIYGAGCGHPHRRELVRQAVHDLWPHTAIEIHSDLLGAARSAWGIGSGLILILGTGMNVGYYDGHELKCPMPSLGYILGDEGSGADLGRHLLRDHFQNALPLAVQEQVFPEPMELADVIEQVYRGRMPQAWMASFVARLVPVLEHEYVIELLHGRFNRMIELLERFFLEVERRDVRAIGSVAHGFQDILGPVLASHGMRLSAVKPDPVPGLIEFHRRLVP